MGEFLSERLKEDTPHKAIWQEFNHEPEENAASFSGILEALFEAQPAVRRRVNSFMRKITALEAQNSDFQQPKPNLENSLKTEPVDQTISDESVGIDETQEVAKKNPPAYLYGNERADFEAVQKEPVSKSFSVGEDAQITLAPDASVPFPQIFTHLAKTMEQSDALSRDEKQRLQENLEEIHFQLIGERPYDEMKIANAVEQIWETETSYAHALIESLKRDIKALPIKAQGFIIQLRTPQER